MGFVGTVRSVLAIGEWAESHWIIGAISFHKIYGLYSVEHHKVEKWSYYVGCGCGGSVWVMGECHGSAGHRIWIGIGSFGIWFEFGFGIEIGGMCVGWIGIGWDCWSNMD